MDYQKFRQAKAIETENKEKKILNGKRFGRLVAIERVDDMVMPNGKKRIMYKCLCDCGNTKIVCKYHLINGSILSCGCLHKERFGDLKRKHGFSHKERLYSVWLNMKDRCYNPHNNHYKSYGGRGIIVCNEWKNDYKCFREWCIANGYVEDIRPSGRNNITIDRIDVNGNYCPENCRFITNKENCLNKRDTLSDEERYRICPICGKHFTFSKRNQQQTCSAKCGQVIRKIHCAERSATNVFAK